MRALNVVCGDQAFPVCFVIDDDGDPAVVAGSFVVYFDELCGCCRCRQRHCCECRQDGQQHCVYKRRVGPQMVITRWQKRRR